MTTQIAQPPYHEAFPGLIDGVETVDGFKERLRDIQGVKIVGNHDTIKAALRRKAEEFDGFDINDALQILEDQKKRTANEYAARTSGA